MGVTYNGVIVVQLRAVCRLRMISRRLLVPNPTLVGGYARARRKVTQVPQDTFTLEFLYIAQQFCLAVLWKALQVPAVKHAHLERLLFKGKECLNPLRGCSLRVSRLFV